MTELDDPRKSLPAVSAMLEAEAIQRLIEVHTRPLVLDAIRDVLDECRRLLKPGAPPLSSTDVAGRVAALLDLRALDRTRPVVNATGILLHTGLGRAVLPSEAAAALGRLDRCCNLQIDLETGLRGKRNHSVEQLLCKLTGAEAAVIVNNNAAATLLILTALCAGKEVVVSRGQLIEIGGSFRLPDCIHQSGARLVEVGTTNKTHLRDYENALSENTGAVMRVNPSNYRVTGFTKEVPVAELVSLKQRQPVIVIDDLGCGALIPLEQFGLPHEPTAAESVAAGADIVCLSGDKLIGGPQAGIIVGKKDLVKRIRKHPLNRMLRVGKLTDVALEHTLRLFLEPGTLVARHPTLRMLTMPLDALKRRANRLKRRIEQTSPGLNARVLEDVSEVGGARCPIRR
ncbi:MAG: L-seryl-tRNA(Sec) selenium transferase [Candidatus Hydrogenedentes bacterium]|nr:L-seryl-tRNA(Sec) selenium transferase [Candidatus Hydrogenedentota bacterium]